MTLTWCLHLLKYATSIIQRKIFVSRMHIFFSLKLEQMVEIAYVKEEYAKIATFIYVLRRIPRLAYFKKIYF